MKMEQGTTGMHYSEGTDDWTVHTTNSKHINQLMELYSELQFEKIVKDSEGVIQEAIIHGLGRNDIKLSNI